MRHTVAALVLATLAALGAFLPSAPVARAATADPKVVIIVGAVQGTTSSYRSAADVAYTEARKYTSNVIKVYSPNATWSAVKTATTGASIVVYFGHGNGWPAPYPNDATYSQKDGFGLNASAGAGDSNLKYYGEPSIATLQLAPNAVVILSRLCYASGNSEPQNADPTQTVARQRVDNYGAAFLKVARAVIADGHGSPAPYIKALFTTHATIDEVWRSAPNYHGNVLSFPSTRTPGATASTDTDSPSGGYYRSLVAKPGLTSDMVTGASYADTSVDPTNLVVPGNASVDAAGGTLLGSDGQPAGSVTAGARLRVVANATDVAAGAPSIVQVQGIDDPSIQGWMAATDLIPRDSTAPQVWGIDTAGGVVSPNGDGRSDSLALTGRFSEGSTWTATVVDGSGTTVKSASGTGSTFSLTWDGRVAGAPLPDGAYTLRVSATDTWGNGPTTKNVPLVVDTTPSDLAGLSPSADVTALVSPDGDGYRDTATWSASAVEAGSLLAEVVSEAGSHVRWLTSASAAGANALTWDGRDDAGRVAPDGLYTLKVTPLDLGGNAGTTLTRPVRVSTTLGHLTRSSAFFYPQDGDTLARSTTLGFTLARPATVTWSVRDATGATVATLMDGQALAAGTYTRVYTGKRDDGSWAPVGNYTSAVVVTDSLATVSGGISFTMAPFKIAVSDTTPARGQSITFTITSAEPLKYNPRLYVYQPGLATWSVATTRTSTYGYRVTIQLKTTGRAGNVTFKVSGVDSLGNAQRGYVVYLSH